MYLIMFLFIIVFFKPLTIGLAFATMLQPTIINIIYNIYMFCKMVVMTFDEFSSSPLWEAFVYDKDGEKQKSRRGNAVQVRCGYLETININGIGEVVAKMDTGNGSFCSIHADTYEVNGDTVKWKLGDIEFETPYIGKCNIRNRGDEERVKTRLNISFNGKMYENIPFAIARRNSSYAEVLLNRIFINTINAVVDPSRSFIATRKPSGFTKKKKLKTSE